MFFPLGATIAAPPFAIMAEELGYFPVSNNEGGVMYVPKRVARASSQQAIELATHLKKQKIVFYGAYWCPHCARQKELFGREAWGILAAKNYVECDGRGYGGNPAICVTNKIDGFPTWKMGKNELVSGEVPLSILAAASKYPGVFREDLEENLPTSLGSSKCK
jgi:thiol-disulfide isomerase/thioredoxin